MLLKAKILNCTLRKTEKTEEKSRKSEFCSDTLIFFEKSIDILNYLYYNV